MTTAYSHVLLVMDRSAEGLRTADRLLAECPLVAERMAAWRASNEAYFLFVMEQSSGRIGSVKARDLDTLLDDVLPGLFSSALAPPSVVNLAVSAEEPAYQQIHRRIEQLGTCWSSR